MLTGQFGAAQTAMLTGQSRRQIGGYSRVSQEQE